MFLVSRSGIHRRLRILEKSYRRIDPRKLPDLKYTKVLGAKLSTEEIIKPNWNRLVERVLLHAKKQFPDFEDLRKVCHINLVQGLKEDEGYRYLSDVDLSLQGLSANNACVALVNSAASLKIRLEITFQWRLREGAAYPGEVAQLKLGDER